MIRHTRLLKSCFHAGTTGLALIVMSANSLHAQATTSHASSQPPTAAAALQWGPCPPPFAGLSSGALQCTTVSVPLDYRSPNGSQISIAISRIPAANPSQRRGVLLLNNGGPGGEGISLPSAINVLAPASVLAEYDLIGFDPRGVNLSSPITCGLTPDQLTELGTIEQPGGFAPTATFAQTIANQCITNIGSVAPFITTANTARDMDQIRQALGEDKISYLGYSYGTYLGAVYASLFPARTDRFVLDSAIDPDLIWYNQLRGFGPGGAIRFPDFAAYAVANEATFHLGQTQQDVTNLYFRLFNNLTQNPLTLVPGFTLNGLFFRELSVILLEQRDSAGFPFIATLWQALSSTPVDTATTIQLLSDLNGAAAAGPGVPEDNAAAVQLAIFCGDVEWPHGEAQYQTALTIDTALFPMFGPYGSEIRPCAFWSNTPIEPPVAMNPTGPQSILIVQNLRDNATIWSGAAQLRADLANRARLVSVDQGGHGAYLVQDNICANNAASEFLANGTFPQTDVFCAPNPASSISPSQSSTGNLAARRLLGGFRLR